jgi:hypothetical protein
VQYGPRIAAIIVYLYTGQFLSRQRTARALAEVAADQEPGQHRVVGEGGAVAAQQPGTAASIIRLVPGISAIALVTFGPHG